MIYLAHIGEPPCVEQVGNLTVERVSADTVREYEVVRAKSFADSEVEPDPDEVTANAGGIAADLGETHLLLGRVGESASIDVSQQSPNPRESTGSARRRNS